MSLFGGESGFPASKLWTPAELSTVFWGDASDASAITEIGGSVSTWHDKSGNSNNATQGTAANQAEIGVRTLNGLDTLTMRNGFKFMDIANTPSCIALYGVVNLKSTASTTLVILGASGAINPINSEFFFRYAASDDISFDGSSGGTGTGKYSLDGSDFSITDANHTTPNAPEIDGHILSGVFAESFQLASILNRSNLVSNAVGHDMCELIATATELSIDDRQRLEGYYAWKWGLAENLPALHPYKTSPPIA